MPAHPKWVLQGLLKDQQFKCLTFVLNLCLGLLIASATFAQQPFRSSVPNASGAPTIAYGYCQQGALRMTHDEPTCAPEDVVLAPREMQSAEGFQDGMARFSVVSGEPPAERFGFLNEAFTVAIAPRYVTAESFMHAASLSDPSDGLALVTEADGLSFLID
jgi:hypothetical protein